jgi:polygalacturonase
MKVKFIQKFLNILLWVTILSSIQTLAQKPGQPVFNVLGYGAVGDGKTLDTRAIQEAIEEAAKVGEGAMVLIPENKQFLIGTIELKSNIEFYLEGNAELLVSTDPEHYIGRAAIIANNADNITISGTGRINGRDLEFMSHYDEENEWWRPKEWRPRLIILTECTNLLIKNFTILKAPFWSLHMLGCEDVLIDGIKIKNNPEVPNCDGIDPDHCRNVIIRNCEISCGDDAIVIKTTRQKKDYGPSVNILVQDCILETQDSGVKIGTETTQDIFNIVFERINITSSCRGLTIQLRDEGDVSNVTFRDIEFTSRYHSDPWWGRGEAISFTAIPRTEDTKIGTIHDILVENVRGKAENSVRINGTKESIIRNVVFDNVAITLDRWTKYPGGLFDNRPNKTYQEIEPHTNPAYYVRYAENIVLKNSEVNWGENLPDYFTNAVMAENVENVRLINFEGEAANPEKFEAINIEEKNE